MLLVAGSRSKSAWCVLVFAVAMSGCRQSGRSGVIPAAFDAAVSESCDVAAATHSYIGCDYYPTVVANGVDSIFDFAVVVANNGSSSADVTVTGPNAFSYTVTVSPNSLQKIYLPWVPNLKGLSGGSALTASVRATGGAFHLVSSQAVTVYQFNPLEYAGQGGPAGKDWSHCVSPPDSPGCFSYSNDASLLLPTTALTGTYRVSGIHGSSDNGAYVAITGTADGTNVTFKVSSTGQIIAGGGVSATDSGQTTKFTLNAGDVVEVLSAATDASDLSGSLVLADKPVQLIAGHPCIDNPLGKLACDHVEESVLPAETLGKHYAVATPTGPGGNAVGQTVRIVGNFDGTHLAFNPTLPGAPATLSAGQVVEVGEVDLDFEVTADQPFALSTVQLGGSIVDPLPDGDASSGDPSLSSQIPVEQYRTSYLFLTPNDYRSSYIQIVTPAATSITLDGIALSETPTQIGSSSFGVIRKQVDGGPHVLGADQPVGIQVIGYGYFTSYQYPGGLDLNPISLPPPL